MKLQITLHGVQPKGKARPRVFNGRATMPVDYVQWVDAFRAITRARVPRNLRLPLNKRQRFTVLFQTPTGTIKPDEDNAIGAIWDAIQVPRMPRGLANAGRVKSGLPLIKPRWGLIANDKLLTLAGGGVFYRVGPFAITFQLEEIEHG